MLNTADVVAMYQADKTLKISDVANHFGIKPTDVSSILRLSGIKTRRGFNTNGPPREVIEKAIKARQAKALDRQLKKMIALHGADAIESKVTVLASEQSDNGNGNGNDNTIA